MQAVRPHLNIAPTYKMMAAGRRTSKTPKLTEAYELLLGKPLTGAHNALDDARAVVELYRWMLAGDKLPAAKIRA
jgi:DNA polymerase-3 subunit epsilon